MKDKILSGVVGVGLLALTLLSAKVEAAPYDGSWESLQKMPVPGWFDNGKIGIFIHWGPYSVIGYRKGERGYSEHVPKLIYEDAKHYHMGVSNHAWSFEIVTTENQHEPNVIETDASSALKGTKGADLEGGEGRRRRK